MSLVLGVLGHVDHGKTALVHALTGMNTDRLPEEQARGISIALGFAHMTTEGAGRVDLIDVPGHERFVRTMVSGATGLDAVLLVVDASEGVMPQTREHIAIAALLGIERIVVAVSRIDRTTPEQVAQAGRAALALLGAPWRVAAHIDSSARTGAGVDALRRAIVALAGERVRDDDGVPWLPIDRAFSRPGHGTVVTGTLRRGGLAPGDTVEVSPGGLTARIRALQVHGARVAAAGPGQRVAVNLRGIEPAQVARGTALAAPGAIPAAEWLSVRLTAVADGPGLATTQPVRLLFGTAEVDARVRLLDRDRLAPGETAFAQLRCPVPVGVPARERFILRLASPSVTVGGGIVLDPDTARARRHVDTVLARLDRLMQADPAGIVAGELDGAWVAGIGVARLARIAGVSPARAASLALSVDAVLARDQAVARPALDALAAVLPRVLAAHAEGLTQSALRALVPRAGPAVLDAAVMRLRAGGVLAQDGAAIRLVRPEQDASAARSAARMTAELAEILRASGLSPPDPLALAPDLARRRALDRLVRAGVAVRAPDAVQKREIIFHREAVAAARDRLADLLRGEGLLVGEVGAALGISRKFSVPLLEHLDSIGFTRRVAERRVLAGND